MSQTILILSYIALLVMAMIYVFQKRKNMKGDKGVKSFVTPISFFTVSLLAFSTALTGQMGMISAILVVVLLLIGAYYTKYLPKPEQDHEGERR